MKRRWKIALAVVIALPVLGAGGFLSLLTRPPAPAKIVDPGPTGRRIDADGLFANYFPAQGAEPHPGVLLLGGSEGGLGEDPKAQALLLQAQGFSTLHLAYHNVPGKPTNLVNVPLENFYRGLDWLKRQPGVDANRIGIVGYSKGAEAGLLVATRYPGIRAVVLGMPSSVVWDGLSGVNAVLGSFSSSWSEKGEPVTHLAYKGRPLGRSLMPVFENGLKELDKNAGAAIPVEKYEGRLMLICGEAEKLWPSCPMTDQIVARARKASSSQPIVLRYKDAGHGVMGAPFTEATIARRWSTLGGTVAGNSAARADSWPKVIAFLRTELSAAPAGPK